MPEAEPRRGWGDLTQGVLDVVARAATPLTPAQVRDAFGDELAYTTVTTVLVRLHRRGLLTRRRSGRAFAYAAVGDPAQITARRMHRLLDVDDDRAGVLARFVDQLRPGDEQLLRGLLREATADGPIGDGSAGR